MNNIRYLFKNILVTIHPANTCRFAVLKETQAEFNIPD